MRHYLLCLICLSAVSLLSANAADNGKRWYNPFDESYYTVQNQAWPEEIGHTFVRIPDRAKDSLRKPLWDLSRNSAGLALEFTTAAPMIEVRYVVEGPQAMPHMPATGVSGVDLYRLAADSTAGFCFGWYNFGDTITFRFPVPATESLYHLNLPLYNTVTSLMIGVPEGQTLTFSPRKEEKPVVVYGTSITQGACASRPGMAWSNILSRQLGMPVYNFGFSGNGRLEPEIADLIGEIDAAVYVIDCLPNLTNLKPGIIYDRAIECVHRLRKSSSAPIILVEHCGYSNAATEPGQRLRFEKSNQEQRRAFDTLQNEGVANLYYITHDQLGYPADAWVDYIHPSDLGAQRHADELTHRIQGILNR